MSAACRNKQARSPGHETHVGYPDKLPDVQRLILPRNPSVALGRVCRLHSGCIPLDYERLLHAGRASRTARAQREEDGPVPVDAIKIQLKISADVRGETYSHSGASIMMGAVTEVVRSVSSNAFAPMQAPQEKPDMDQKSRWDFQR